MPGAGSLPGSLPWGRLPEQAMTRAANDAKANATEGTPTRFARGRLVDSVTGLRTRLGQPTKGTQTPCRRSEKFDRDRAVTIIGRDSPRCACVVGLIFLATLPTPVSAHGYAPPPERCGPVLTRVAARSASSCLPLGAAALHLPLGGMKVNAAHPHNLVPRFRYWSWMAGLLVLLIALASPIGTYDTTLFSVHMVQHLLLTMVAAPLLAHGRADHAASARRRRPEHAAARDPAAAALVAGARHLVPGRDLRSSFAAVMWGSHFSPLFDASLDNEAIHIFEHALYLGTGPACSGGRWWAPILALAPAPPGAHRLPVPGHAPVGIPGPGHLFRAGGAVFALRDSGPNLGPTPVEDQALAGGIMWVGGDVIFLIALLLAVWVWLRAEEAEGRRLDAQLDREEARQAKVSAVETAPRATAD